KHFTLDKKMPGPDQKGSADPQEMITLRAHLDDLARARGTGIKMPTGGEEMVKKAFRRSVVMAKACAKGHALTRDDVALMRPGTVRGSISGHVCRSGACLYSRAVGRGDDSGLQRAERRRQAAGHVGRVAS